MDPKSEEKAEATVVDNVQPTVFEQMLLQTMEQMQNFMNVTTDKLSSQGDELQQLKNSISMTQRPLQPLGSVIPEEGSAESESSEYMNMAGTVMKPRKDERRDSYLASSDLAKEADRRTSGATNQVALLHVQRDVEPNQLINVISIQGLIEAKKRRDVFVHRNMQEKELVHFFTADVHQRVIANEMRLNTTASKTINEHNIFLQDDTAIENMVTLYVRSNYATSWNAFQKLLLGFTAKLTAKDPEWELAIPGYDQQLHSNLVRWKKNMTECYDYLMQNVTVKEAANWPKEQYGSKEEPQTLGMMHYSLGKFAEGFERLIGKADLKKMNTVKEYLKAIGDKNTELCAKAIKLREDDAINQRRTPLKEAQAELDAARAKAYRDKQTPKPSALTGGNAQFGKPNYPEMPKYGTPANHRGTPYVSRHAQIEAEAEQSFASEVNPLAKVAPYPDGFGYEPEWSEDDEDPEVDLAAIMGGRPEPRQIYDPKKGMPKSNPIDPKKPCYAYFKRGCDGSCGGYSHDTAKMEELAFTKLEDIVTSRFGGEERTRRNLEKILTTLKTKPPQQPFELSRKPPHLSYINDDNLAGGEQPIDDADVSAAQG